MKRLFNRERKHGHLRWRDLFFIYIVLMVASQVMACSHRGPTDGTPDRFVAGTARAVDQYLRLPVVSVTFNNPPSETAVPATADSRIAGAGRWFSVHCWSCFPIPWFLSLI